MARAIGSFCTLLLIWLCALGVAPASSPTFASESARSAVELTLREVADAPRVAARVPATPTAVARPGARTAPPPHWPLPRPRVAFDAHFAPAARLAVGRQATAYAARRRWRAYDAAAPPAPPPPAR